MPQPFPWELFVRIPGNKAAALLGIAIAMPQHLSMQTQNSGFLTYDFPCFEPNFQLRFYQLKLRLNTNIYYNKSSNSRQ